MHAASTIRALVIAGFTFVAALTSGEAAGMSNLSAVLQVPAGGSSPPIGFVISGTNTPVLVRAIGPSLIYFGIKNTVAAPALHYFNSTGTEIFFSISALIYDWSAIFTSVGAFPLTGTGDAYTVIGFNPGAYTITITDNANKGGTVLLELYQNPTVVAAPANPGV